jgi:uncharacterized protein YvpB
VTTYLAVPQISYTLANAAAAADVSLSTIKDAIDKGDLVVTYVGPKATKPVIRAVALDEWVAAQPNTRRS